MAGTGISIRHGVVSAGSGSIRSVQRILADLCTSGNPKDGSLSTLRKFIEEETRDLSGEAFLRFMDHLYDSISSLLKSKDVADNLGALRAIDELIDVTLGENASKVSKFSSYMRMVFEVKRDHGILILGSKIKNALDWLHGERIEYRRFAAVLILKEMAENASTVFNVHVPEFVDAIWVALRDPTLAVREKAVEALRACLRVIEKRETRWRVQWYREVADIVLKYLEHRDRLVRLSITLLLPRIAHFLRDRFVTNYLKICMDHILAVLRNPAECAGGFIALGEMAGALDGELLPYMPTITLHLRDAIAPRRGRPLPEAFVCVGCFAKAMGATVEPHLRGLLDSMFSSGLSTPLIDTLGQITVSIPSLLPTVQERLLDCISMVLSKNPFPQPKLGVAAARTNMANNLQHFPDINGSVLVQLALRTLAHFNFKGYELLEFARNSIVVYLEDEDGNTRRDAAICCCRVVASTLSVSPCLSSNRSGRIGATRRQCLVEEEKCSHGGKDVDIGICRCLMPTIMKKLLVAAVSDADVSVRRSVFLSLQKNVIYDKFLAQADSLFSIFVALNDEDFDLRELAISMAGRLSEKNPAYVLPKLRLYLRQLITYLGQSMDTKCREESAQLLGYLIRNCERLVVPYIAPIQKALVAQICDGTGINANNAIVTGVLATVGELAKVGGNAMRKYVRELIPLIVEALMDGASFNKREVALATLGQVVQSTGYVITPYIEYPQLLGLLLKLLSGESAWSTRREVLKVLGIMGSLDPHVHKCNQQVLPGSHGEVNCSANDHGQHIVSFEELPTNIWPSFVTSEDYYSTVAISSLMQILRDSSLSSYHQKVVGSIIFIFKSMGLGCVPYLPKVLPELLHALRTCEDGLKEFITWKLGTLVSIVRQHIRKYLSDLLPLILELWASFSLPATNRSVHGSPVLHLVEQLSIALNDEFRTYLPAILRSCIQVLIDAERCNDYNYVSDILHTFDVFGGTLDEHMHLLFPALIRLLKIDASTEVKRNAIKTLTKLIPRVQVSGHVSALVHHLKLVLDGNNEELRGDAADALCCLACATGEDFAIFIPSIRKILSKHHFLHLDFEEIEKRVHNREPLVLESFSIQRSIWKLPVEFISDPINGVDGDPYVEGGSDAFRQSRGRQESVALTVQVSESDFPLLVWFGKCCLIHHVHLVNDPRLMVASEASQRSTKEDWAEWMRHFSIELLKESPSPALHTCARLAQLQPSVGRELFAAGFASCWLQMNESSQERLVRNLKTAFSSPNIPSEILATLLNLAEFMEHEEKPLPIDTRLLGALAEKCRAFAKALHYKEMEFEAASSKKTGTNPVTVVESLIHINNQLHQHEAAIGILTYSQQHLEVQLKESWYEKLQRWDEALKAYTEKSACGHNNLETTLGRMRCLAALARWEELNNLCKEQWSSADSSSRLQIAPMAANAAWNMGEWDQMTEYVSRLDDGDESKSNVIGNAVAATGDGSCNGAFFRAVLLVRRRKYEEAREFIEKARKCLAIELATLVIDYCTLPVGNCTADGRRELIRNMWNGRIQGVKRNVEVWQALLAVRELVLPPSKDIETWLKFASLCRKSGRIIHASCKVGKLVRMLLRCDFLYLFDFLQYDPDSSPNSFFHGHPRVIFAYLKYQWSLGDDHKRREAFSRLQDLALQVASSGSAFSVASGSPIDPSNTGVPLLARVYLKLGTWQRALTTSLDDDSIQGKILISFKNATQCTKDWAKAWHIWALFNTAVMSHYTLRGYPGRAGQYIVAAVTGYFYSIACASTAKGVDDSLQDILRLLTLWFNYGATSEVQAALQKGFSLVKIEMWLAVLPQIIARIHSNNRAVRELIQSLLVQIGKGHPQALMYPLLVACKSISVLRKAAAQEVVDKIRQHSGVLVDQAQLVSKELIRVSILWHEMWHEALEEASRLYFGEHNTEGMLAVLDPLHAMLEEGPETLMETAFIQAYGHELLEARECCFKYRRTGKDAELTQITMCLGSTLIVTTPVVIGNLRNNWGIDTSIWNSSLHGLSEFALKDAPLVTIASFAPQLMVITSKQRPRKLTIHGSDGEDYAFLLKGHEDLRQDERVMQLFGLVNTLLESSRKTSEKNLSIQRYAVIPLSPNSGLIGWVPNCDTLHHLIREYRDARKMFLNQEHRLMLAFAPDYDRLPLIAKVEVFEHALQNTEGNDLAKVLWLKSRTSEVWLARRTNYSRSLAVMSMVGYLLGLGDRHPSNLMLHRYSGKILHIDFGDCFEASMNREKFPEKVPFRLTRMLLKAMEVSGIEGTFRLTCENVMQVLRTNKDSVMAMMEVI
ncbi:Serine/threonine-protein kinase TOR [Apostasia shenzhenica]|uniref:Serine/threonine-protein kinase TOR n=1 Tax=Apostasia shenzhenica TaxID=1088818 RepID=A0A2I0A9J5_9ASPA|nr:Serine/threonine-protein kinase TOR [Apostasia shenzhenica]